MGENLNELIEHNEEKIELYLSQDILQGEKVPFYIIWDINRVNNISKIKLVYRGFDSLIELYNVKECNLTNCEVIIEKEQLKTDGYIGGILSTNLGKTAKENADLQATIYYSNGLSEILSEERLLHSARAEIIYCPNKIDLPINNNDKTIKVNLSGDATVMIGIGEISGGLELTLPPEVLTSIERFTISFTNSLNRLKNEFPNYKDAISSIIDIERIESHDSYTKYIKHVENTVKEFKKDEVFIQSLYYSLLEAILEHESLRDSVLIPMLEYMESNVTSKAFFFSPFICVKVPTGGGNLKCELELFDILEQKCNPSLMIDTFINSDEEKLVPLKEIIKFDRGKNHD